ncbi:hypothetical protein M0741_11535, partial [Salmonella enterica subsp. enterica serovar Oranienburg]|nr:hypothetical protein [Salmonella enterica subsp. enterica serovar Oranienburg]
MKANAVAAAAAAAG